MVIFQSILKWLGGAAGLTIIFSWLNGHLFQHFFTPDQIASAAAALAGFILGWHAPSPVGGATPKPPTGGTVG